MATDDLDPTLVKRAHDAIVRGWNRHIEEYTIAPDLMAEEVVREFADRLLPPVVETREEWGWWSAWSQQFVSAQPPERRNAQAQMYNHLPGVREPVGNVLARRTIRELSDGSTLIGPWRREETDE